MVEDHQIPGRALMDTPIGLTGHMLIGAGATSGREPSLRGINPATGQELEPAYGGAGAADLERACALAEAAFDKYRETSLEARARFLEQIAENILAVGDALIERAQHASGLPHARILSARARDVGPMQ